MQIIYQIIEHYSNGYSHCIAEILTEQSANAELLHCEDIAASQGLPYEYSIREYHIPQYDENYVPKCKKTPYVPHH